MKRLFLTLALMASPCALYAMSHEEESFLEHKEIEKSINAAHPMLLIDEIEYNNLSADIDEFNALTPKENYDCDAQKYQANHEGFAYIRASSDRLVLFRTRMRRLLSKYPNNPRLAIFRGLCEQMDRLLNN